MRGTRGPSRCAGATFGLVAWLASLGACADRAPPAAWPLPEPPSLAHPLPAKSGSPVAVEDDASVGSTSSSDASAPEGAPVDGAAEPSQPSAHGSGKPAPG
ncbi:hypothetical protein [Paraliomyxa miuraensis]|uniref:hypothetical protein n=1 Tax=Paraliomyxa miuraensis TaxID=376150 RepID=UPI00225395A0|nr:hypothetical protein [Paraliomyxa miuraensis]MCX4245451.1 hypothetical protein [Paraliomyxa miuraensis]